MSRQKFDILSKKFDPSSFFPCFPPLPPQLHKIRNDLASLTTVLVRRPYREPSSSRSFWQWRREITMSHRRDDDGRVKKNKIETRAAAITLFSTTQTSAAASETSRRRPITLWLPVVIGAKRGRAPRGEYSRQTNVVIARRYDVIASPPPPHFDFSSRDVIIIVIIIIVTFSIFLFFFSCS